MSTKTDLRSLVPVLAFFILFDASRGATLRSDSMRVKRVANVHKALESLTNHIDRHKKFEEGVYREFGVVKNQSQQAIESINLLQWELGDVKNQSRQASESISLVHSELGEVKKQSRQASEGIVLVHGELGEVKNKSRQASESISLMKEQMNTIDQKLISLRILFNALLCPHGFVYSYPVHKCYKFVDQPEDWDSAKQTCKRDDGASLVAIETEDEMQALEALIDGKTNGDGYLWTAGNNLNGKGDWKWGDSTQNMSYSRPMTSYSGPVAFVKVNSTLMTPQHIAQIRSWLHGKSFRLLYRATRDGASGSAFHNHCDNKGPTISIGVEPGTGNMFGGYTSVSWTTSVGHKKDEDAFIFQICNTGCTTAKYNVKSGGAGAVWHAATVSPLFGFDELRFFDGQSFPYDVTKDYFQTNGHCFSNRNYYPETLSCSAYWTDLEVFAVKDGDAKECMALKPGSHQWFAASCSDKHRYICEV